MKRTIWTGLGYTLGLGTSVLVQRRVRRTIDRYAPEQLRNDLGERGRSAAMRARSSVGDLRDAAREGVAAMRQERDDLLVEFGPTESRAPVAPRSDPGEHGPRYRPRHSARH